MNVFLSWSGESSRNVAKILRNWLPCVLQALTPIMSTEDIDKGARWNEELAKQLDETACGILCLTSYNIDAPWLNFEAGAISKAVDRSRVLPFLFRIDRNRVTGPLQQFQSTVYKDEDKPGRENSKEDVFKLLTSLNRSLASSYQISHALLQQEFEMWWGHLEKSLSEIKVTADEISGQAGHPISEDDLLDIHERLDFKTAWIVVSDESRYIENDRLPFVIEDPEKKGEYTIFTHSKAQNGPTIRRLAASALASPSKRKISVVQIDDEKFGQLVVTDFVFFNPDPTADPGKRSRVFLSLPVEPPVSWIEVTSTAADGLIERFRVLKDQKPGVVESVVALAAPLAVSGAEDTDRHT